MTLEQLSVVDQIAARVLADMARVVPGITRRALGRDDFRALRAATRFRVCISPHISRPLLPGLDEDGWRVLTVNGKVPATIRHFGEITMAARYYIGRSPYARLAAEVVGVAALLPAEALRGEGGRTLLVKVLLDLREWLGPAWYDEMLPELLEPVRKLLGMKELPAAERRWEDVALPRIGPAEARAHGIAARGKRRYEDARFWFVRAVQLAAEEANAQEWMDAQLGLGRTYFMTEDLEEARRCFLRALYVARRRGFPVATARALHALTNVAQEKSDLIHLERYGLAAARAYGAHNPEALGLAVNVATCWIEKGFALTAARVLDVVVSREGELALVHRVKARANAAVAAAMQGDRARAHQHGAALVRSLTDEVPEADRLYALTELARTHALLGDRAQATAMCRVVESFAAEAERDRVMSNCRAILQLLDAAGAAGAQDRPRAGQALASLLTVQGAGSPAPAVQLQGQM